MQKFDGKFAARFLFYLAGMVLLALGLTLNTLTGLGASAIVSIPFTLSEGTGLNFGDLTFLTYCVLVAAQFVVKGKNRTWVDLLQLVVSLLEQYDGLAGMSQEEVVALLGGDTPGDQREESLTPEGNQMRDLLVYRAGGRPWAMFPEYFFVYLQDGRVTGAELVAD